MHGTYVHVYEFYFAFKVKSNYYVMKDMFVLSQVNTLPIKGLLHNHVIFIIN